MDATGQTSHLRAENLRKSYNRRPVVKGVNISVQTGQIIGLLGRNGAGKTTSFQMIVGLIKPNQGSIYLNEKNISHLSTHQRARAGITYLPQENSVFLKTTVEKNLKMILQLHGYGRADQNETIQSLLEDLELFPLRSQSANSLSGGERRKLEIGRTLILNPKFLLLDEPFTGIDPLTIRGLHKIFLQLKNKGIGIILSDHNVQDTLKIADYSYIIDEGEILVEGPPKTIAQDDRAKERFLGKGFKLGGEIQIVSPH